MTTGLAISGGESRPGGHEAVKEEAARIAREVPIIAKGRAELDAGRGLPLEALKAWLHRRRTDPDAPLPESTGVV